MLMYELLTGGSPFTVDGDENSHTDIAKYGFSLIISHSFELVIVALQHLPYLCHTSQEDFKEGSSFPQRYGTTGQRPYPATPNQRSKEEIRLRSERSRECKETPVLPGGPYCLSRIFHDI